MKKITIANKPYIILPAVEIEKLCIELDSIRIMLKVNDNTTRIYTSDDERVYDIAVPFDDLIEFIYDT